MKTTDFNITINENVNKINFADFGNGSTDQWIKRAEKRLGVKFPNTYIYWLKNYFGGEIVDLTKSILIRLLVEILFI